MKTSVTRIIRRRKRTSAESAFFKKEGQEPGFFASTAHETFFQPAANTIQRTPVGPEEAEKVHRTTDKKEEEKKLKRLSEKKEEENKLLGKDKSISDEKEKVQQLQKKKDSKDQLLKEKEEKDKEENKLQRKENNGNLAAPATTVSYINTLDNKGTPLPKGSKEFFGTRMDYDFNDVKIHTGPDAERSAKEVNAKAYTIENHIVFNEGQFDPDSNQGQKLLAHELAHVVQKDEK